MQPNASQDAILGHWHSELIAEECRECGEEAAIHTVDCFMGELCESVEQHKHVVGQVTHVVDVKQTGKQQVTDLRFGRLAKVSLEPVLARQRCKKRRKAEHMDSAAVLLSNTSDMAEAMRTVHRACEDDNEQNNSIVKTWRAAGFGAWASDGTGGLVKAEGGLWDSELPMVNNRIEREVWNQRFDNIGKDGQPAMTPWHLAHELRKKQAIVRAARELSDKFRLKIDELDSLAAKKSLEQNVLRLDQTIASHVDNKPKEKEALQLAVHRLFNCFIFDLF